MSILAVACKPMRMLWGSLIVDLDQRTIWAGDRAVAASRAEFDLLTLLLRHRNDPLSKDFILSALFGTDHGRDVRQVDAFVARLRLSLQPVGLFGMIATVPGRGYAVLDPAADDEPAISDEPSRDRALLAA